MRTSEDITTIAPALVKAMGSIGGAKKDGKNPHYRSSYATLGSVIEACQSVLTDNELCFMQDQGGITEHNTVVMTTRILHSSGQWIDTVCEAKPKSFAPQDVGSSITYLRRYGLMTALGIPAEDDDGHSASTGEQQKVKSSSSKKSGASKTESTRKIFKDLQDNIHAAEGDIDALTIWGEAQSTKDAINQLPADWQNDIRSLYKAEKLQAMNGVNHAN